MPSDIAVITSECQSGVIGPQAMLPELAAAAADLLPRLQVLLEAARAVQIPVVHCLFAREADNTGSNTNARLFRALLKMQPAQLIGSEAASLVPELQGHSSDLVLSRRHGLNPMAGTDLDAILRNLGVRTLVVTGVSVNVAITNLVMDAVNLGYEVVLPRDCVAGVPAEYADAVIDTTLSLLATVTTSTELAASWR